MRAVQISGKGGAESLYIGEYPEPKPAPKEVLVKVEATAINRADILQREGKYPVPAGESPILGLEMAGTIVEMGEECTRWHVGDKICGLLGGGGHAEYAVIHEDMAMPVFKNMTMTEAAAIPEVFLTAYQALHWLGRLKEGEKVLIHAGASGVGTAAIQLAKASGAKVWATASKAKHESCLHLGADQLIDYKNQDFEQIIREQTEGKGVDVIVDFIAAPYFQQNLNSLATDGRLIMLALLGGPKLQGLNLLPLITKRLQVKGSTLRSRSLAYKIKLSRDFLSHTQSLFDSGKLKAVIDSEFSWKDIAKAHQRMEENMNTGKIVLKID
jgi:tumor protein p53-inducible protein 3